MTTHETARPSTVPERVGSLTAKVPLGRWTRRILVSCLVIEGVLLVLDVVMNYMDVAGHRSIRKIFNIAREESLPTWFASTQALFAGLTVLAIFLVMKARGTRRRTLTAWAVFAAFFVFIGLDDAAALHEKLGTVASDAWSSDGSTLPSYGWHFFILPFFALMGLWLFAFLWQQFRAFGLRRWLVAGLGCLVVAVGLDYVEGIDGLFEGWARDLGWETYSVSHFWRVTEEMLEMVGTTLLWGGFLHYLSYAASGVRLNLTGPVPVAWARPVSEAEVVTS